MPLRNKVVEELLRQEIRARKYLDIGCADGSFTMQIAKNVGAKLVYGVDISPQALKEASNKGIKTFHVDLNREELPFKDDYFDLITCIEVIEHLIDTDNLLFESRRCLRKNGYFVITTPNLASYVNRFLLLLGYTPGMYEVSFKYNVGKPFNSGKPYRASGHLRLYTLKALIDHLQIYGFRIISLKGTSLPDTKGLFRLIDYGLCLVNAVSLFSELIIIARK